MTCILETRHHETHKDVISHTDTPGSKAQRISFKMRLKRHHLAVGFLVCCAMTIILIYYCSNFHVSCYSTSDEKYSPPLHLIEKWSVVSVAKNSKDKLVSFTKFPPRNTKLISDRLEKLLKLMQPLNDFLMRLELSKRVERSAWNTSLLPKFTSQKKYLQQDIKDVEDIANVFLTNFHPKVITSNFTHLQDVLEGSYFNTTALNCTDLVVRSFEVGPKPLENPGCNDNLSNILSPNPLSKELLYQRGAVTIIGNTSTIPVTYINVFEDAFVDGTVGDILTENLELIIQRCCIPCHKKPSSQQVSRSTKYDEVFSIAQYWGYGYYHHTSEQLPRLVPFLPFLTRNTQVFIHVLSQEKFVLQSLEILGINASRVVSGDIHARVLYSPVGGRCTILPLIPGQMMSLTLRQTIQAPPERRSLILIQRSHKRYFYCHNRITEMLQEEAAAYRLELEIFSDNPTPSLQKAAEMFSRAIMVVAPHGAGLANMVYSEPGTVIIEGVCFDRFNPKLNPCYENMALVLGHRYVAVNHPTKSCHYLQAADIKPVVKYFLHTLLTGKT